MSHISENNEFSSKGKRNSENEEEKPYIEFIPVENELNYSSMDIDYYPSQLSSLSPFTTVKRLRLDNGIEETCEGSLETTAVRTTIGRVAHDHRTNTLDHNIFNNIQEQCEFEKQSIIVDESLTIDEKTEAIKLLTKYYDKEKTCQLETLTPDKIIEWIPFNNIQNINYLTKGGFSKIYTADWTNGCFYEWDSVKQQLKRIGTHKVILKKLENTESASLSRNWFDEVKHHLILSNKHDFIVRCFGLTKNPSNGNYMLMMRQLDTNLRKYLRQNHNKLTWKGIIQIAVNIVTALSSIHKEGLIHTDLHSGNILYYTYTNSWYIGDFGACRSINNESPQALYGNLSYIAPEIITNNKYSFASDIYSFAILMWEISSGKQPYYQHNYDLATMIINGMRPEIVPGTPIEYKILMEQCWDADPSKRPDIVTLTKKIREINLYYQSIPNESIQSNSLNINNLENYLEPLILIPGMPGCYYNLDNNNENKIKETTRNPLEKTDSRLLNFSNIYIKPKNATEEELKAFYNSNNSSAYNFNISQDFNSLSNKNNDNILESSDILTKEIDINNSSSYSERQDESHNNNDNNSEVKNSIFWSDALEARLCELYMKDDVIDIYWGRPVEENLSGSTKWNIYVITRGLYYPYVKTEMIADGQVIHFIAEEVGFAIPNDPLPSSIEIPQDLKEIFDEALDNELGLSFREAHYNLVGIGTGYKQIGGKFTEIPAIIFYVRQKGILRRGCDGLFPKNIHGFPTDVIEACAAIPCAGLGEDTCRRYQENVRIGSSIGMGSNETQTTTGTLSAVAYENISPNRIGIISCEHVLKFNESNSKENITIYQPSYDDQFEPRRRLKELLELSQELGENEYKNDINIMKEKLNISESQDSKLATYVKGIRKNFKINNKEYGIDAGFCVFDNESRKLYSKNFPIPQSYLKNAGLSTSLEGTYTYNELKFFNYNNRVFKVGRTTGLTLGQLLPTDQAIACTLTHESIKDSKNLEMEKHIPCYDNADQKIFIGYMKSQLDSEIRQKRKKCYPAVWFDRQLVFKFKSGDFDSGDSGASIIDETGKALGILHAKWITSYQTYGIASPYFAVLEALNVSICLSPDGVTPTITSSSIISPPYSDDQSE
ncbi:kinase-like domain-containing protein [Rhizophagus clarus]|uniref:Kinase-like domain-containing protein n=1 Tax=Rhizophagus clarus TaxID=94130 RepID=A0A8H3R652_9GLOM|nr:kinase-like domain-containing protein [Rhizophagus clarus]